jgi:hypothetical protein
MAQAETVGQLILTFKTNEDLSSSAYRAVLLGDDDYVGITASNTVAPTGILTSDVADGSSTAAAVSVCVSGVCTIEAGGAIDSGDLVMATTAGKGLKCTTGNVAIGQALEGAANGDLIPILIDRHEMS